jgi:hypothetical protein
MRYVLFIIIVIAGKRQIRKNWKGRITAFSGMEALILWGYTRR